MQEWQTEVPRSTLLWTILGFSFLVVTFSAFGVWSNYAKIAGAVVTTGTFVATGENKTIQHLEGGVIRQILVQEGDLVVPGQPLMVLDDTAARAELRRLTLVRDQLQAQAARLMAEAEEKTSFEFPASLAKDADDPEVEAILAEQKLTFNARRKNLDGNLDVLKQGEAALLDRIDGSDAQKQAMISQIGLFKKELDAKEQLLVKGLVLKPEVLALQRALASAAGEVGRLDADMANARDEISRTHRQMIAVRTNAVATAFDQLHDVRANLGDTLQRIRAAQDVLERTQITAPVRGVVVNLRYHTIGGVVGAGSPILQIVPVDNPLLIEARIRPQDIEHVKEGQYASVRLTALPQRITPMINADVIYISADALPSEQPGSGQPDEYVVRVKLDTADLEKELPHFRPAAGMPAEVYIKTSGRTFFQYVTEPIKESMTRAFREP
jgi:HlyD family secretion protein